MKLALHFVATMLVLCFALPVSKTIADGKAKDRTERLCH